MKKNASWRRRDPYQERDNSRHAFRIPSRGFVLKVLEDPAWCRERLGLDGAVGRIDPARLNAWGGSLSLGHPFGATGARLVTSCAHRMQHENARHGLIAACAAGALGIGLVLERP